MAKSGSRLLVLGAAMLVASLAGAGGSSGESPAREELLAVALVSPTGETPLFGEVVAQAEVTSGEAVSVTLLVDDRALQPLEAPPFVWRVDVGQDNRRHRFEVIARSQTGAVARASVEIPALRVDLEVEVELQQLYVSALLDGEPVEDLEAEDFVLRDDGRRQSITTFARGDLPFTALLLVDASDSMKGTRLSTALAGARRFLADLRPLDQAKLLLFSDSVVFETPFSTFGELLEAGLETVEAGGGTALNDHLYLAVQELSRRSGRRVVVILSDGVDTASVLDMKDVLKSVRRSSALIYWLRIGDPSASAGPSSSRHSSSWRSAGQHQEEQKLLEEAVQGSGGRVIHLPNLAASSEAFRGIFDELRHQYVLGYSPEADRGDGAWHRLRLRVLRPGVEVRTAAGYYDF